MQKAAYRPLLRTPLGLLAGAYLRILLLAHGEVLEGRLLIEASDSIRTRLEVQPEWPLDGDLAIAEVSGREDLRDDHVLGLPILGNGACDPVLEFVEKRHDLGCPLWGNSPVLFAQVLDRRPERGCVDQQ